VHVVSEVVGGSPTARVLSATNRGTAAEGVPEQAGEQEGREATDGGSFGTAAFRGGVEVFGLNSSSGLNFLEHGFVVGFPDVAAVGHITLP
jgi:hypothetical protein